MAQYVTEPSALLLREASAAGIGSTPPVTIMQQLRKVVMTKGGLPAFRYHRAGAWHEITWKAYHDEVTALSLALIQHGFGASQVGAILGTTRPEWLLADVAIIAASADSRL